MIFLDTKSIRPQVVLTRYTTCPSHWCGTVWQICEGEIGRCLCPTVWRHQGDNLRLCHSQCTVSKTKPQQNVKLKRSLLPGSLLQQRHMDSIWTMRILHHSQIIVNCIFLQRNLIYFMSYLTSPISVLSLMLQLGFVMEHQQCISCCLAIKRHFMKSKI